MTPTSQPAPRLRLALLALGGTLLAQAARAQQAPVAPLAPRRVAATVPKPDAIGQEVPGAGHASIRIVCRPGSSASPPVLVLLNSQVLAGWAVFSRINPRDIVDLHVYKDASGLPGWPAFTSVNGLIDLKLRRGIRVPSISLNRLKHRLHLTGTVQFEQYGQLLPAAPLCIAKADVGAVTVRVVAPGTTRVVLPTSALPTKVLPPGAAPRILVRGVAGQ